MGAGIGVGLRREEAWNLLCEYTKTDSLRKHALSVEAAMIRYASHFGEDAGRWSITGLLHDFDYERWPDPPEHTREGAKILRSQNVDEEIVGAILAHAEWNLDEYPRDRPIRKALFAVDELCGLIMAAALIRPNQLADMTPKTIRKKMKASAFAASVSRTDITQGAELLEVSLDDHFENCIVAMQTIAPRLGLRA